ncbi:hypothetical protein GALMADRAFT_265774 [Galerina marginata CBS 339.88]|uniref:Uncharacterized protein n=1 Tax=Galerina marginata (strain CBS 339.88) TaxID=685588 RepID=A0A067TJZ5_GALM3|nr:hypothetical protein GALMADRAFT_265774 [Galerina marginata CBS 339.88]
MNNELRIVRQELGHGCVIVILGSYSDCLLVLHLSYSFIFQLLVMSGMLGIVIEMRGHGGNITNHR